jgi:hypothetical protein
MVLKSLLTLPQLRILGHAIPWADILGATPARKKELVGFQVGPRESAQSWRELLVDIKARGLAVQPEIVASLLMVWTPPHGIAVPR